MRRRKLFRQVYEHRKPGVRDRILKVASVFAIDAAAYAIMSNHYHIVLHVDADRAKSWSTDAVIDRCHTLFNGNPQNNLRENPTIKGGQTNDCGS